MFFVKQTYALEDWESIFSNLTTASAEINDNNSWNHEKWNRKTTSTWLTADYFPANDKSLDWPVSYDKEGRKTCPESFER